MILLLFMLFHFCKCVPLIPQMNPYPGLTRYQMQLVMPTSNPYPATLSTTLIFNSPAPGSVPPKVVASITEMDWTGYTLFEFVSAAQDQSSALVQLINYPINNTANQRINLLRFHIAVFELDKYTFTSEIFEYVETSPCCVSQLIQIANAQLYDMAVLVAYEDYYTNIFTIGALQPQTNFFLDQGVYRYTFNYTTSGTQGYLIKRIKYQYHKITRVGGSIIPAFEQGYYGDLNSNVISPQINNNQITCPGGHFYGLSSFNFLTSSTPRYFNLYVFSTQNCLVSPFSYYRCYRQCPLSYPYYQYGNCLTQCSDGNFHLPPAYYCEPCTLPCLTCMNYAINCTSCVEPYQVLALPNTNFSCICPSGQFGIPPTCTNCNATIPFCVSCDNSSYCLKCDQSLVYNLALNTCECPSGTSPLLKPVTYSVNGVNTTVNKLLCISGVISESCNDRMVTVSQADSGLIPFGLSCQCMGGAYLNSKCQF